MIKRQRFYFMRHGQSEHNANPTLAPENTDSRLTPLGQEQARSTRHLVEGLGIDMVCHSPLKRVIETMRLATEGLTIPRAEVGQLVECSAGTWLKMRRLNEESAPCEEVQAFFDRVCLGLNEALSHGESVLIVAHGGLHFAFCRLMGIEGHDWILGNCELVHFEPDAASGWRGRRILASDSTHLQKGGS